MQTRAILFDLDDTLYPQSDYVRGAYWDIAKWIGHRYEVNTTEFYESMFQLWLQKGSRYPSIFSETLRKFGLGGDNLVVGEMIRLYNAHDPCLTVFPETVEVLETLRWQVKMGIVSDGNPETQRRKLMSLDIAGYFDICVFTGDWGRSYYKPHPRGYEEALRCLSVLPKESVFVGDTPEIDLVGAKKIGMRTVCIYRGHRQTTRSETYVDFTIRDLRGLISILERSTG